MRKPQTVPPPETARLRFREYTMDDLPLLLPVFADPETMEFLNGPHDEAQTRERLETILARYERDGHCFWAVERRDTDEWIGHCGLLRQHIDGADENEVAYTIKRHVWGHGYATEAARAVKAHAFQHYGYDRVVTIVHPANVRSICIAMKNGMELWKQLEWHGVGVNVYGARL